MAGELQQLLTAAGISPPYVLAAHSFGGIVARQFAACNRSAVADLVLMDSGHEDQARLLQVEKRGHSSLLWALRRRSQILGLRRLAASAALSAGLMTPRSPAKPLQRSPAPPGRSACHRASGASVSELL